MSCAARGRFLFSFDKVQCRSKAWLIFSHKGSRLIWDAEAESVARTSLHDGLSLSPPDPSHYDLWLRHIQAQDAGSFLRPSGGRRHVWSEGQLSPARAASCTLGSRSSADHFTFCRCRAERERPNCRGHLSTALTLRWITSRTFTAERPCLALPPLSAPLHPWQHPGRGPQEAGCPATPNR